MRFSFRGPPKNDFSAIFRPIFPTFLSLPQTEWARAVGLVMDGFQLSSALGLWFLQSSCHKLVYFNYLDFYGFCCTSTVYLSVTFL